MIKLFEEYNDIHSICEKYNITNYTINVDGSIDVNDNVNLHSRKLIKLPLKFRNVTGHFDCCNNQLTSLEGSPRYVRDFYCHQNKLTSLEGGPIRINGDFDCYHNGLTTLKNAPKEISGSFDCSNNQLTSLEGCTKEVGSDFDCFSNKLTSLEGGPKKIGGVYDCSINKLRTLKGGPIEIGFDCFSYFGNPLPELIYHNIDHIKDILRYQDDYSIWNADGSLNEYRFRDMMEEIKGL